MKIQILQVFEEGAVCLRERELHAHPVRYHLHELSRTYWRRIGKFHNLYCVVKIDMQMDKNVMMNVVRRILV